MMLDRLMAVTVEASYSSWPVVLRDQESFPLTGRPALRQTGTERVAVELVDLFLFV
jgi:hypothetical protein